MPIFVDRETLKISVALSLFIRYSENLRFIYKTTLLHTAYATVQFLSQLHVSAITSPSVGNITHQDI